MPTAAAIKLGFRVAVVATSSAAAAVVLSVGRIISVAGMLNKPTVIV